jgi:peptide/nickel transport system substrate-binding protein
MSKSVYLLLAVILGVVLLLSACGTKETPTTSPVSSQPAATSPTSSQPAATSPVASTSSQPATSAASDGHTRPGITSLVPADQHPKYGGVFVMGTPVSPTKLVTWNQGYDGRFMKALFDTLVRIDENGELQPWLATSWELRPDGRALTLHLRNDVKFHDGTPFNAEACKWNIEMRKNANMGDYTEVQSIDILDEYTLRLNLSQFNNTIWASLWHIAGMMSSPTAYQKYGPEQALWNPVGTGPFKFVSYAKDQLLKLERFDDYWRGKPYLDGYECHIVADKSALEVGVRMGEVHTAEQLPEQAISQMISEGFPYIESTGGASGKVIMPDSINPDSPFADKRVREAFMYAVDLKEIADSLGYGMVGAMTSTASPGSYAYVDGMGRPYDPQKAKQLLADAGYPNGFDCYFMSTTKDFTPMRQAYIAYLEQVGIKVNVDLVDMARMYSVSSGGWESGVIDKNVAGNDWLKQNYNNFKYDAAYSVSWARPKGLVELLEQAMTQTDLDQRNKLCQDAVKLIDQEAAVFPEFYPMWHYPITKAVKVYNAGYLLPWDANALWTPADVWIE